MKNKILILAMALILGISLNAAAQRNSFAAAPQTTSLQTLSGDSVSLEANGKVVVLAIGASWLPLSKQQITTTNKLTKQFAGRNVVVYWITTDSGNAKSKNFASNEQIQAFAVKNKLTATILRDSDGAITLKKYSVDQIPSFVVLDKTGKMVGQPISGLDPENEAEIFMQVSGAVDKAL